ncbi:MAG: pyridoxamine 5'-phosphate oxidase family protein [Alphaproteobacteria bacterium]|nr:pyridoxamine 5'-phosphate oxidase family protein [Alphaproteobacteria bacterium]
MSPQDAPAFLPFHADEQAAQALAGVAAGRAAIRPFMPEQHRTFFAGLGYLFTATLDDGGWPMGSMLWGAPGFIGSPDAATLHIHARPHDDDPAGGGFAVGREIGLLGLDLTNRRRNRANGRIASTRDGITVSIAQSFGNCAQYIQTRTPRPRPAQPTAVEPLAALPLATLPLATLPLATLPLATLDAAARALIAGSDTFFVASRSRESVGAMGGPDMSHRGGRPGFVALQGDTLVIPDFRGNRYFNTLGNLLGEPRAGLLFVDFATGDLLQLQGRTVIDWHPASGPAKAERLWRVEIERGWRRRGALPFSWTFDGFAPTTLATGVW